ncbi:peptidase M15 [Pontibacillus halophilus JSM 076056 = DSM 19796]|uniref:Peptidase M15 n=1 Tax=Pontibacillus halophilus JSM 076056 = DSM 19796 TaxID=1385510 RepID=A0A0A5GLS6_9BACI|nr:peptidoglycan-binding protein [Pontibacillus halophilus]KGX92944.1 peptidase M15 [Pontibacillus halophilus JSM 076056 = DSM 19796]
MFTLEEVLSKNSRGLNGLHPVVKGKATQLIENAYNRGVQILITDGYRSFAEQQRLYNQGRTTPGSIVTNARPGQSYHNYGLAIDFALYTKDGRKVVWDTRIDGDGDGLSDWDEVVIEAKKLGFKWGGDWVSFRDFPHFEYTFGLSIRDLLNGKRPPMSGDVGRSDLLQRGDSGTFVETLQQQLNKLGYNLTVDGDFGPDTERAVRDFQQSQGLKVDGIVGRNTREALTSMLSEMNSDLLQRGAEGELVEILQKDLNELGYRLQVDGDFGPNTEEAVKEFQQDKGLTVDGIVGPNTREILNLALESKRDGLLERGEKGDDVKEMQQKFKMAGYRITVDGNFGPSTEQVVESFQRTHGLQVDGIYGPNTERKLDQVIAQRKNQTSIIRYPNKLFRVTTPYMRDQMGQSSIKAIQRAVGAKPVDGIYGPSTAAAVKAYQRRKGLTADGIVGPSTWRTLF